ncbi:hypothetical protein ACFL6X_06715 [Candidatus Latescibacterota bacterium]
MPLSRWLSRQIDTAARALCGHAPTIVDSLDACSDGPAVVVSSLDEAEPICGQVDGQRLGPEDFGIEAREVRGRRVLLVYGRSLRCASYGVFRLFEQLGCRFLISRDVYPPTDPECRLTAIDEVGHTDNKWRGMWFQYCFATNSSMSLVDYAALFDQMAKMRLNRIVFYHFENEPFIDYTFRGERKVVGDISHPDSGYISYGRHFSGSYRVADIPIGGERFGRERVAPLELQKVASSEEALEAGKVFMREVIHLARERGIGCWLAFLPQFIPLNLLKYARRMPRPHLHWSGLVSAADPVVDQINQVRLQAIVDSYPELEGIFLGIPEGYYEDPYLDSRDLVEGKRPEYERAFQLHRQYWGKYWSDNQELLERHLRQDIGFAEILQRTVGIARQLDPGIRLGVITVCKAYLLTHLHTLLPPDIAFADIESRSLWTVEGAPLHLFREMEGRDCMIIPRAVDDGSMVGMQFDLKLYAMDRYLQSARENGTAGLIVQTTHVRGNEHNLGYLAAGMWDAQLTPEAYYGDYAERLFGPEAAPAAGEAFDLLEESEILLGGRGSSNMPWNKVPAHVEILRALRDYAAPQFGVPYDQSFVDRLQELGEGYAAAVSHLERAQERYQSASAVATESGRGELTYLMAKNTGYAHHLRCLVHLGQVYGRLLALFDPPADVEDTRLGLDEVLDLAGRAAAEAEESARSFAAAAEHPTDLGVLWMVNSSMVTGTRVLQQYLRNVRAYYRGEEYWGPVDWDKLFGSCPHPAYGTDVVPPSSVAPYEPG